jgi:phosphoglycerol geranylgeranyltransferase
MFPGNKVKESIFKALIRRKLHFTLIDPDKQSPTGSADIAEQAVRAGTFAILVGGSTGVTPDLLEETVTEIKSHVAVPVIQFPNDGGTVSTNADAILFLSLLNSTDLKYIITEPRKACRTIYENRIEAISVGYVISEPGMRVGKVGKADLVKVNDVQGFLDYGLLAQFLGMDMVYFESGSGSPETLPPSLITEVASVVDIPIIVGGGIMAPETATRITKAGASIIVTGNLLEDNGDVKGSLEDIIQAIS